jgi:hypothetical protein
MSERRVPPNSAVRWHYPLEGFRSATSDQRGSQGFASVPERGLNAAHAPPDRPCIASEGHLPLRRLITVHAGQGWVCGMSGDPATTAPITCATRWP